MAKCPRCGYKLQLIDFKAECPVCGVNIPNYNWEERLDSDAAYAEKSFAALRKRTSAFKSALFGGRFRVLRFIFTFVPLLFLLCPLITYSINLPFSEGSESASVLDIILSAVGGKIDFAAFSVFLSSEKTGAAFTLMLIALILVFIAVAAAVLNFFVLIISSFGYHAKGNIILCSLSVILTAAAAVLMLIGSALFASSVPELVSSRLSFGLFVGILLFGINLVMNVRAGKQFKEEKNKIKANAD